MVSNIDECYLSCDVLRGLKIIDASFPKAGGMHQNQLPLRCVKSAKRLLRDNCTPSGHLNTDAYMPEIMSHRNTKDRDSGMSPTEVVYGKNLTDAFRFMSELDKYSDERVQPMSRGMEA